MNRVLNCASSGPFIALATATLIAATGGSAIADVTIDVSAGAAAKQIGIDGFDLSESATSSATTWSCQVVGTPSQSATISVRTDGARCSATVHPTSGGGSLQIESWGFGNFEVKRDGVVLAKITASAAAQGEVLPIMGQWTGLESLGSDPAWAIVVAVAGDPNLSAHLRSRAPGTTPPAEDPCRAAWPIPTDCEGAWDRYLCGVIDASYGFCRSSQQCPEPGAADASTCLGSATGLLFLQEVLCVKGLSKP